MKPSAVLLLLSLGLNTVFVGYIAYRPATPNTPRENRTAMLPVAPPGLSLETRRLLSEPSNDDIQHLGDWLRAEDLPESIMRSEIEQRLWNARQAIIDAADPAKKHPWWQQVRGQLALPSGWQAMSVDEKITSPGGQARINRFDQLLNGENAKPINVYGKVIDQYGKPVVGAIVKGGTLLYINPERSGGESFSTITDVQGDFSFTGLHGVRFGFGIEKLGYEYDPRKYLDWWDNYKPDPQNPAVFVMWKLKGAEPMMHANVDRRLPYDERAGTFNASFDLSTGKMINSGDFHITLIQNPVVVKRALGNFTWKIIITVPGGNLVEATDLYKNLAPESGYQDAYSFAQEKDDPKWTARFVKIFYVHTAKGQYAKVIVDLTPGTNRPDVGLGIGLSLATWLNPSGSRNLEFDETKKIKTSSPDLIF